MSTVIAELIRRKLVTKEQLSLLREKTSTSQKPIQDLLVDLGCLKEDDLFSVARKTFHDQVADLDHIPVDPELIKLIPFERARFHGIFPAKKEKDILFMAMSDPSDVVARDEIQFLTNMNVRPILCKKGQISRYIDRYYRAESKAAELLKNTHEDVEIRLISEEKLTGKDIVELAKNDTDSFSMIRLVNKNIPAAVQGRAPHTPI